MDLENSPRRELRFAGAAKVRGLRPTGDRLLVRIEPGPAVSDALIVLPGGSEIERRRIRQGQVIARPQGDGRSPTLQVGDVVLFPAACGQGLRLRIDGHEHVFVREGDILATLEDA